MRNGFTLIEVLIVIAIVSFLASLGLFMGFDAYRNYSLSQEADTIVTVLEKARNQSLNNLHEITHGVHFASGEYTLFRGSSYNPSDPTNEVIPANIGVSITGLNDVVFSQIEGSASPAGDIQVSNGVRTKTISINDEGRINW